MQLTPFWNAGVVLLEAFFHALQVNDWGPSTLYRSTIGVRLRSAGGIWRPSALLKSSFGVCLRYTGDFF